MKTLNREVIKAQIGYEVRTTFYEDLGIAEAFGIKAVKETYKRAFKEWKENTEYITELCMMLNLKTWEHCESNYELAKVYHGLWMELQDWCYNNLKGDDLAYFIRTTD